MRARFVFDGILNELKSWNAGRIERQMIGAARIAHGECGHAEILERAHPAFKNRRDRLIFLQVNAANLARAVVHVEIRRHPGLLRLHRDRASFVPQQGRLVLHQRIVDRRPRAEVMLDVSLRAQQALLFACP